MKRVPGTASNSEDIDEELCRKREEKKELLDQIRNKMKEFVEKIEKRDITTSNQ